MPKKHPSQGGSFPRERNSLKRRRSSEPYPDAEYPATPLTVRFIVYEQGFDELWRDAQGVAGFGLSRTDFEARCVYWISRAYTIIE